MADDCDMSVDLYCRNKTTALHLKAGAIVSIMVASTLGVAIPLVGRRLPFLRTDGNFFFVAKAFAAGVILATGFVHILPDAQELLGNPCLPEHPWAKFPWPEFIAMVASLLTLMVDFVGTEYYERKHSRSLMLHHHPHGGGEVGSAAIGGGAGGGARINSDPELADPFVEKLRGEGVPGDGGGGEEREGGGDAESNNLKLSQQHHGHNHCGSSFGGGGPMHIVGMRAHAASHSHSHADGQHGAAAVNQHSQPHHVGHQHVPKDVSAQDASSRHVVISQVLELGIITHSVLIGLSLGASESPCTIRPLMTALVFHQFFEGFALGGCISQAGFKFRPATVMAMFFAITTPFGICLGIGISSTYNENSDHALIVEGVLNAISAGILIYMALVDLIAADFLSKRLRCDRKLQLFSYVALFGGAGAMGALAIWA